MATRTGGNRPENQTGDGIGAALSNRPFLFLWLAQVSTQVGGNIVMYALMVVINDAYGSNSYISGLMLTFLLPAILFSALAGVVVDRVDKRELLVITNALRGSLFLVILGAGDNLAVLYPAMVLVSTTTTFFAPAEASMIPKLLPKRQLLAANGIFSLTSNVAFALGFALLGPLLCTFSGASVAILLVAFSYFVAAGLCWTLPASPPIKSEERRTTALNDARSAVGAAGAQFIDGIDYVVHHGAVSWSLSYLAVAGALVGVISVLGVGFVESTLHLRSSDFGFVVLPIGLGVVTGILVLNSYGNLMPRRRSIEVGLVAIGTLLLALGALGRIESLVVTAVSKSGVEIASSVASTLSLVMVIAFAIGACYSVVAISAQTQLQEDLPEEVRGRVFGMLNMLVSTTSLLPIILVGPAADLFGRDVVIVGVGVAVGLFGLTSILRHRMSAAEGMLRAPTTPSGAPVDPVTTATVRMLDETAEEQKAR